MFNIGDPGHGRLQAFPQRYLASAAAGFQCPAAGCGPRATVAHLRHSPVWPNRAAAPSIAFGAGPAIPPPRGIGRGCMSRPGIVLAIGLAGCGVQAPDSGLPSFMTAEIETGDDGRCYGRDITPAVIQTVTAPGSGSAGRARRGWHNPDTCRLSHRDPAGIVRERRKSRLKTLCPPTYSAEFVQDLSGHSPREAFMPGRSPGSWDSANGAGRTGLSAQRWPR